MQMTLVGESSEGRRLRDGGALLQQSAGQAHAVGDLHRMRRKPYPLSEQPHQAELADSGDGGQFVESYVAIRVLSEIVAGNRESAILYEGQRRTRRPHRAGEGKE